MVCSKVGNLLDPYSAIAESRESRDFSRVGRITHAVVCLHHLLPYVGTIGTIDTNGITNGTIGKTLNGICLPMVPFLPLERTTNARNVSLSECNAAIQRNQVPESPVKPPKSL